jgi:hypothetical protein
MRNLYKLDRGTNKVYQMTDLITGISGISGHSPMISAASKKDRVIYTHYLDNKYILYEASSNELLNKWIEDVTIVDQKMGMLPVSGLPSKDIVDESFRNADTQLKGNPTAIVNKAYKPQFKLDYLGGGGGIGVGVNNNSFRNATGLQGRVDMLFSDLLGNNQLYSQLALNGEILDMGAMVSYINRKNKIAWGVGLSHVPLRTGYQQFFSEQIDLGGTIYPGIRQATNIIRIFDQSLSLFGHLPFSTTLRLEGGIAGTARSFRWDEYNDYYIGDQFTGYQRVASDSYRR